MNNKAFLTELTSHATKNQTLKKFLLLLAILIGYFSYLNFKFDFSTSALLALITWSFFVLATPVADAGFLLDFPLRLILGIRMMVSEVFVWVFAILLNVFALLLSPQSYEATFLTSLFKKILTNPYPYWIIIILSGIGTFLSIRFGDELMDVLSHKDRDLYHKHSFKFELIVFIGIFTLVIFGYYHLLESLGITFNH